MCVLFSQFASSFPERVVFDLLNILAFSTDMARVAWTHAVSQWSVVDLTAAVSNGM